MSPVLTELKPAHDVEMVFKFVSEQPEVTGSFRVAECSTSIDLFTKARKFFQIFNRYTEVILSRRLASRQEHVTLSRTVRTNSSCFPLMPTN